MIKFFKEIMKEVRNINNQKEETMLEQISPIKDYYWIRPYRSVIVEVDDPIQIPENCIQTYHIRSSLQRRGITAGNSVGDSEYYGKLRFLLTNNSKYSFSIQDGSRFIQVITHTASGTGSYQEVV
jgi:deoxycytidine triphosphate deaminase